MLLINALSEGRAVASSQQSWVNIPSGSYRPLFVPSEADPKGLVDLKQKKNNQASIVAPKLVKVDRFKLQIDPVTNRDFLVFVLTHPEWQMGQVKPVFADKGYLRHWSKPTDVGSHKALTEPVVNVSWFAAQAYCEWVEGRLPSTDEWEYVASLDESKKRDQIILDWYSTPAGERHLPSTGAFIGKAGIRDMYGKIWEWTIDFNSSLVTGESREDSSLSRSMFCAAGSIGATKPSEYASFMRFAFRSSLKGNYTVQLLGFRCAKDVVL